MSSLDAVLLAALDENTLVHVKLRTDDGKDDMEFDACVVGHSDLTDEYTLEGTFGDDEYDDVFVRAQVRTLGVKTSLSCELFSFVGDERRLFKMLIFHHMPIGHLVAKRVYPDGASVKAEMDISVKAEFSYS